jgi:hypothetical protein
MEFIVRFKALPHLLHTKDCAILQDDLPPPSIVGPILEASSGCFSSTSNLSVVRWVSNYHISCCMLVTDIIQLKKPNAPAAAIPMGSLFK